jgi:hypothetical protein
MGNGETTGQTLNHQGTKKNWEGYEILVGKRLGG